MRPLPAIPASPDGADQFFRAGRTQAGPCWQLSRARDVDELMDARSVFDYDVRASPHHVRSYQDCDRPAMPGDRDFLAVLDSGQEFGQ
jgi:hypothetical protein